VMRRETLWADVVASRTGIAAAGTAVLINVTGAGLLALRPFTVIRTRGEFLVQSDQSAATEFYIGRVAAAVVSDQAVAIGVTALPTPATDAGSDLFFMYEGRIGAFDLVGTSISSVVESRAYDSKAMRKVEDGSQIVFTIEAGLIGNGMEIGHYARILIKLH